MTPSRVSQTVSALERRLGTRCSSAAAGGSC
ncbi:hypothetical protein [Pseudonocardia sp. HH130630-07]